MHEANQKLAGLFERIADILEIQEANPFRVRAYRRAAESVSAHTRDVREAVAAGEEGGIPGIGKDLAAKMREFAETGRLEYVERLEKDVPPSLTDLLRIKGLVPKTLAAFHKKLGVKDLAGLEKALASGKLAELPGVRAKTAENLRKAIETYKKGTERRPLPEVWDAVEKLRGTVAGFPGVSRVEIAGSYRRRRETVGDADLLAVAKDGKDAVARFVRIEGVERVLAEGETKGSVEIAGGFQVDLRVVHAASFGAALQYFTGSQAHGVRVRGIAREKGLKLNEYGLFRGERSLAGKDEEAIYKKLGLPWIPPELREDAGEVEAAREGRLPDLVTVEDIRGDLHLHTDWSDGKGTLAQMVEAAAALGHKYLAVTDHSHTARIANGLDVERLEKKREAVAALARKTKKLRLLMGAEVEILKDGSLDYPDEVLLSLDVVVAGLHYSTNMSRDRMTGRILDALDHPGIHILAHPTGRLLASREPYEVDLDRVFERCAERGIAVEVSAAPRRLDLNDVHARRAAEIGCRIAIDTDAHRPESLGLLRFGVHNARRGWVEKDRVVNCLTWTKLEKWLEERRG